MLVISCVQERDKGCWLSVGPKRVINGGGYQLCPKRDKRCLLSVVSKRVIKDAGYQSWPGEC